MIDSMIVVAMAVAVAVWAVALWLTWDILRSLKEWEEESHGRS